MKKKRKRQPYTMAERYATFVAALGVRLREYESHVDDFKGSTALRLSAMELSIKALREDLNDLFLNPRKKRR